MTKIELITAISVVLCLGFVLLTPFIYWSSERGGAHTGYISAVDQEGILFPNYKVFFKTDSSSSQEDQYCVHRNQTALAAELRRYSETRELVTIRYNGVRGIGLGLCSGEEILTVEPQR